MSEQLTARVVPDINAPTTQSGDIELRRLPDGEVAGYAYRCPRCSQEDWLPVDFGTQGWVLIGSVDWPTLRPSILHRPCGWHGYLTDGEFRPC